LYSKLGHEDDVAAVHFALGVVAADMGRHGEARRHLQQALSKCTEIGLTQAEADVLVTLANLATTTGQYRTAHDHFLRALETYRGLLPDRDAGRTEKDGPCAGLLDDDPEFERFLVEATAYPICWGRYLLLTGEPEQAATIFAAVSAAESRTFPISAASEIGLGLAYEASGRQQEAADAYRRAVDLIEEASATTPPGMGDRFLEGKDYGFARSEAMKGLSRVRPR
jgi:tetratricopeptide (TPR) repeat protein